MLRWQRQYKTEHIINNTFKSYTSVTIIRDIFTVPWPFIRSINKTLFCAWWLDDPLMVSCQDGEDVWSLVWSCQATCLVLSGLWGGGETVNEAKAGRVFELKQLIVVLATFWVSMTFCCVLHVWSYSMFNPCWEDDLAGLLVKWPQWQCSDLFPWK